MAKMRILSSLGDTVVEWDTEKAATDVEAAKAVKEAERISARLASAARPLSG